MHAARVLYAEIGREVERNALDSVTRRAVVPVTRKARCLTQALIAASASPAVAGGLRAPALPATRFLVEAVAAGAPPPSAALNLNDDSETTVPWWKIEQRMLGLIDLFERLERRQA
jgi:phytoene synthase